MTKKAMVEEMNKAGYLVRCTRAVQTGRASKEWIASIYRNFLEAQSKKNKA